MSPGSSARLVESAPAKINLTLRVLGRRSDGYHEIESLVAFAEFGDRLHFSPGRELTLAVNGPMAAKAGAADSNLVLKAAREMTARHNGLALGAFRLEKQLPVAAGLGGGSADAAAALRLIARANGLTPDDPELFAAARATGADVPVCLDPRPRIMRGLGEILSAPLTLPALPAVLVNPGVAVATKEVFASWATASSPSLAGGVRDTRDASDTRGAAAISPGAVQRSGAAGHCARAHNCKCARSVAGGSGMQIGADVRVRRDVLCALWLRRCGGKSGQSAARQISAVVGTPDGTLRIRRNS